VPCKEVNTGEIKATNRSQSLGKGKENLEKPNETSQQTVAVFQALEVPNQPDKEKGYSAT